MKKLKPLHWILIAVLLVEAIVLGVWFGAKQNTNPTGSPDELKLTYEQNTDGSFTLLSLLNNASDIDVQFSHADTEYSYDVDLVQVVDAYRDIEKYKAIEPNATEELWNAFKDAVSGAVNKQVNQQHASIEYIRNIAKSGYNVPHEQLYNNHGMYTINTTTTIDNWTSVFAPYILSDTEGKTVNELAMGATIRIGSTDYPAIVYTSLHPDEDKNNNDTAPEVTVHILFGDHIISDIALSDATIYYLKPDGSEYFAHSNIKVTYMASGNEARYRDILIMGGLQ